MATEDDFQPASDNFMDWFRNQHGAKISLKIALVDFRSRGRGRAVVATEDIESEEVLFEIPRHLIMDAKSSDLRQHIAPDLKALEPWLQTVLVMIYESGKARDSKWYPYLEVLPHNIDHLLINWSDEELAELQGSAIRARVGKEEADREVEKCLLPIVMRHPDVFGTHAKDFKSSDCKNHIMKLAHQMASVMMAYAFDVRHWAFLISNSDSSESVLEDEEEEDEPAKGMVPLADMLNASGPKHNASIAYGERELIMYATNDIKSGEEIYNTYGDLPRAELLRRYGYINEDYVAYDVVEISTAKIIEEVAATFKITQKEIDRRTRLYRLSLQREIEQLLQRSTEPEGDLLEDAYDTAKGPSGLPFFPLPLIYTVWLLVADESELAVLKASHVPEPRFNLKVAYILRAVLLRRQRDYQTSVDEDKELLEQTALPVRTRLAVEVRLGEKLIVQAALEYFYRMDKKLPGGLDNWKDNPRMPMYLLEENNIEDPELVQNKPARKRRLNEETGHSDQ